MARAGDPTTDSVSVDERPGFRTVVAYVGYEDPGSLLPSTPGAEEPRPRGGGGRQRRTDAALVARGIRLTVRTGLLAAGRASYLAEAVDGGTRVTSTIEMDASGFLSLAEPLVAVGLRREVAAAFRELKKVLEAPAPTGSPETAAPQDLADDAAAPALHRVPRVAPGMGGAPGVRGRVALVSILAAAYGRRSWRLVG